MSISVIIPWSKGDKERQEGLEILFECIKAQTFRDFELVLAEMTRDGSTTYLPYKPDQHIVLDYAGVMNKSWVCNVGVRNCKHDSMLFLDADTQFKSDFFAKVVEFIQDNKFFCAWDKCMMLAGRDEVTERQIDAHYMKAAAHAWFVDKTFYWSIGGMNEKYFGYGNEDQDFWERGMHILKVVPNMPYTLRHTYHHYHPINSAYPLNEKRVQLFEDTMKDISSEINNLRRKSFGKEKPCE